MHCIAALHTFVLALVECAFVGFFAVFDNLGEGKLLQLNKVQPVLSQVTTRLAKSD